MRIRSKNSITLAMPVGSMPAGLATLPVMQQVWLGLGLVLVLIGSIIATQSLIPFAVILGLVVGYAVVRNPVWSIFAFIAINVYLTLRTKNVSMGGAPNFIELLLGVVLALMIGYWILRIRLIEGEDLGASTPQLLMVLFSLWAFATTLVGFVSGGNQFTLAIREMLNLSPLIILPIICLRYLKSNSKEAEFWLIGTVLVAGCIMITWSFIYLRSGIARAFYLYQAGRPNFDQTLSGFLVLMAFSALMQSQSRRTTILAGAFFLFSWAGVIITLGRTLYVATFLAMGIVLFLGDLKERRRGIRRVTITAIIAILGMIPFYYTNRTLRLLLSQYGVRFISTQHIGGDLSMRSRYVAWADEIHHFVQSPIIGFGFGSKWRVFDLIQSVHTWPAFSHNSYLFMGLKTGVIGTALFFMAYFGYIFKGFRIVRTPGIPVYSRAIARAGVAFILVIFI